MILSNLLRMTINRNNEFVTIHDEMATVQEYVKLLKFRYNEKVDIMTDIKSDTLFEEIPRLILQPLIENAYIHGLQQKAGVIVISAWKEDNPTNCNFRR